MPSGASVVARIERAFKKHNVPYRIIAGATSRGSGNMGTIYTITAHHTAGGLKGNAPSRNVVKNGRPGLRNALCNLYLPRDGVWEIMAGRTAWHAGKVRKASYTNSHNLGIEAENTGLPNDSPWPKRQYDSYALGCKALAEEFGASVLGHKEICSPAGRKIDPSFSMPAFRTHMRAASTTPTPTPQPEKGLLGMTKNIYYQRTKRQSVKAGADKHLQITDKGGQYTIVSGPADFSVTVRVDIAGLPKDKTARLKLAVVSYKAGTPTEVVAYGAIDEVYGSDGYSYAHATLTKRIPKEQSGRSLRVRALLASDVDVEVDRVVVSGLRD